MICLTLLFKTHATFFKHIKKSQNQNQDQRLFLLVHRQDHVVLLLIILIIWSFRAGATPAKLKLFGENGGKAYEISARNCRAGLFLPVPTAYSCACVTGVWGFYTKYCKSPLMIVGGDNYCFSLQDTNISQVIIFGNPRYPFEKSLTHFREGFRIMTKAYVTDDDRVDLDAASTFLSITPQPWTLTGNTGETLCLMPTNNVNQTDKRQFCVFDVTQGLAEDWGEITEIRRGCLSKNTVEADSCEEIHPPNDEKICQHPFPIVTTESSFDTSETTTTSSLDFSSNPPGIIEPRNIDHCKRGFTFDDVKAYWESQQEHNCPRSITELVLRDQLKRFGVLQMNKWIQTRQRSLEQTEELLQLLGEIFKVTCPHEFVPAEFIDVVTEAFTTFVRDDFFYGVEETEASLFETIVYNLRTCLKNSKPFQFMSVKGPCNDSLVIIGLAVNGTSPTSTIDPTNSWRSYEIIIESVWKIFINAHSYCFEDFLRQNDHNVFAVRMMSLFSSSIYEKWIQPLASHALYKFILPNADTIEQTMDNLDQCVNALASHPSCPVWLDRISGRMASAIVNFNSKGIPAQSKVEQINNLAEYPSEQSHQKDAPAPKSESQAEKTEAQKSQELQNWLEQLSPDKSNLHNYKDSKGKDTQNFKNQGQLQETQIEGPDPQQLDKESERKAKIQKRSIWMNHIQGNRASTEIWNGSAHCLDTPEDPGFFLGFGRCAHP